MYPCVRAPPGQIIWYDWSVSDIIDFLPYGPIGPSLCLWWPNKRISCKNDGITSQIVLVCMSFGQLLAIGLQNKERQRRSMISDKNQWYTRWPIDRWPLGRRWYRMKSNDLLRGSMIPLPWEPQRGKGRLYLCLENLKEARAGYTTDLNLKETNAGWQ